MYHRDKIIGVSVDDNIDSWYTRNQEIGEIFAGLITEEGKVEVNTELLHKTAKIVNNNGVDTGNDNMNVLKEQVVHKLGRKSVTIQKGQVSLFAF